MNIEDLWSEVGISDPSGPLEIPLRFRADKKLVEDLDRLEFSLNGAGYRVSRSEIVRALLASAMEGIRETFPLDDAPTRARTA